MTKTTRTALLIDADNVSTEIVTQVIERLHASGHLLQHRRAYGSVQKAAEFSEFSKDHAIRFLPSTFAGPNATDIALAIDAVELVLRQPVDEVVLVSSDMDYSPLIVRLRELGCRVTGYGQHGKSGRDIERDYERVYDEFTVIGPADKARPPARTAVAKPVEKAAAKAPARRPAAKTERKPRAAASPPKREAAAAPAPARVAVSAALPKGVEEVLAACPELRQGGTVRLNGVAKSLHDHGILKKNGKTTSLFKKLVPHFELVPADKPESVRFRAA